VPATTLRGLWQVEFVVATGEKNIMSVAPTSAGVVVSEPVTCVRGFPAPRARAVRHAALG